MSTLKRRKAPKESKNSAMPDPYQQVTDLIIEHLEAGVVPWRCPWNRNIGRPRNFHSGKEYQGANVILLGCRFASSPWWLTFRQALELGGHVRKGEHGAMVVKYGTFNPKDETEDRINPDEKRRGMFLRTFTVFNASQIDGIAFPQQILLPALSEDQRSQKAESIVAAMPQRPVIREGGGIRACYCPARDEIEMPPFSRFDSGESYYATLFHELGHASGHPSRLNRESLTKHDGFGGQGYSQEELVAEMCAAFVGTEAEIVLDRHEQSAAYLHGWLTVLKVKDHRRWLIQAAGQAGRAADFILNRIADHPVLQPSTLS